MKTLILYDSTFGNTEAVALALVSAFGEYGTVKSARVSATSPFHVQDADVVLIGGPTQQHGLSPTLRAFLAHIPHWELSGLAAAAFDTRYHRSLWTSGSAARGIARRLRQAGAALLLPPESFFVSSRDGPLEEGELTRARAWARQLAKQWEASCIQEHSPEVVV